MSIDRRIVSILFQNGITDVTKVEKFLGEKNNYYEVIVDGKLLKLRIPDHDYTEPEIFTVFEKEIKKEEEKELIKTMLQETLELAKNLPEPTNDKEQKELDDIYDEVKDLDKFITEIIESSEKVKDTFEQKSFEEELLDSEKENKDFENSLSKIEVKKTIIKTPIKKDTKKEVKKPKKLDDDIDDFIDLA
jgi:hypothetical protein